MTAVAGDPVEALLEEVLDLDSDRRAALRALGRGVGVAATGCLGGVLTGLLTASPMAAATAAADPALDIQILQTASSLETLVVDLYGAALGTGPLGANAPSAKALATMTNTTARDTLVKLLTETQNQHREHRLAFQTATLALGGKEQNDPNPKYTSGVASADVSSPLRLVDYAAVLEKILTDTYVVDLTLAENVKAKETLAAVMAVEAQHLALLRTVGALLRDGTPQFLKIPFGSDLVNIPATLAAVAFPSAIEEVSSTAEPGSGAVP
ncbi:MAG: hypothetical protein QOG43_851 [Actinomycetota bacterium]|jgi:hypothetical protein|nr:hypothetical protein [Actinomycetota bacterium]